MKYDIIIAGAGPAGLSFASSLAECDLSIAIVEKLNKDELAAPPVDGRDIALTHLSVRLLKELGIWCRIPPEGISQIKEARVIDGVSSYFLHFDPQKVANDILGYIIPNHLIRKALYERVITQSNVNLITDTTVTSMNNDRTSGSVGLSSGETLEAELIVAADSRFSKMRRHAGISASIRDFGHTVMVCEMEHEKAHNNIAYECFHYGRTLAVLPLTGNMSSIVITAPDNLASELQEMDEAGFNADIQNQFKSRLGEMKLVGGRYPYPLFGVYSDKFVATRFALIGDAAVGMHPVTAHGFNFGLSGQDLLSNEIKLALSNGTDIGSSIGLKNYQAKHRRATKPLYLLTNKIVDLYTNDVAPAKLVRKIMLRLSNNVYPVKRAIINRLTELES